MSAAGLAEVHPSGQYLLLTAAESRELRIAFARLPGARLIDSRSRRWLMPMVPRAAHAFRALLSRVEATSEVLSWLARMPSWGAVVGLAVRADKPLLELTVDWGDVDDVSWLAGHVAVSTENVCAHLSVANLRAIERQMEAGEFRLADTVGRAWDWVRAHPATTFVPGAELAVYRSGQESSLVVDVIWDRGVEQTFVAHEMRLVRERNSSRKGKRNSRPPVRRIPPDRWPRELLSDLLHHLDVGCAGSAASVVETALEAGSSNKRLRELSSAVESDLFVPGLGGELMPYQLAAVEYALERRRVILADERGLGKTAEALAAVEADNAFPAIVVCPGWLTLHWLQEAHRWLPSRQVVVIDDDRTFAAAGEIFVVSESSLPQALSELRSVDLRAAIFDEAQRLGRNRMPNKSAVIDLAERLPVGALRMALTATPVAQSFEDAAVLMRLIGRLHEFPSASPGPSLERHLRGSCLVRRRRQDLLLQLPVLRRAVIPIPAGEPAELVEAAIEWIDDFLASGERLVVFSKDTSVILELALHLPDALLVREPLSEPEAQQLREGFVAADGPQLCVAHTDSAHPELWLHRASNVAFVEPEANLRWREQAENCVGPVGSQRAIVAWYLAAQHVIRTDDC